MSSDSEGPNKRKSSWQQKLYDYCAKTGLEPPVFKLSSDRRGGQTAWSCKVRVGNESFPARFWYDGSYTENAKEDAAEEALKRVTSSKSAQSDLRGQPGLRPDTSFQHDPTLDLVAHIEAGNYHGVEQSLQALANLNKMIKGDMKGGSPLILAVSNREREIIQLLLAKGVDVNMRVKHGLYGNALIGAIRQGDQGIVNMLLEAGADVNQKVTHGLYGNALIAAANNDDIMQLLLKAGVDVNMQATHGEYGSALISVAASGGNMKLLLEAGADVNMQVAHGLYGSALIAAIVRSQMRETIEMLLEYGADVNLQLTTGGYRNALEAALAKGNEDTIRLILDAGAHVMDRYTETRIGEVLLEYPNIGSSTGKSTASAKTIVYEWELPEILQGDTGEMDINKIPTLTKMHDGVLLLACTDYLEKSYGSSGVNLLKYVVDALKSPDNEYEDREINLKATRDSLTVRFLCGTQKSDILSNAVAWLCMTFRAPPPGGPHISSGAFDGMRFRLNRWRPLRELTASDTTCWTALFDSIVIVLESLDEQSSDWGLAVNFQNMMQLSAVEYPITVDTGIVLMGYSTALVPVRRRDMHTIEWHLEISAHNRQLKASELYATKGSWMQTNDLNELISNKNILGWCPNAEVRLGTIYATADILRSDAPTKQTSWHWTGANLQLLAQSPGPVQVGGQFGLSFSRSINTATLGPSKNYLKCIMDSKSEQIIVYDTTQERAWLVPLVCVLHHMLLCYSKMHDMASSVPQARKGSSNSGGQASYDALKDSGDLVLLSSGVLKLTIRDLIMGFSVNLSKISLHKHARRNIYGYEFMDIITDSTRSDLKYKRLDKQGLAWMPLLAVTNCLFCSNLGDAIIGNRALCLDSPCNRVPQGQDLLTASICSISKLFETHGAKLRGGLNHCENCWKLAGTPFQQCSHERDGDSCWKTSAFLQDICSKEGSTHTGTVMTDNFPNAAVVFGRREPRMASLGFSSR